MKRSIQYANGVFWEVTEDGEKGCYLDRHDVLELIDSANHALWMQEQEEDTFSTAPTRYEKYERGGA